MVSHELLARVRRGDPRAFEEVVRATHRQAYTLAFRLVADRQEAEDVAQEAYLRVLRGLAAFREDSRFETWLHRIVTNTALNHLRRRGRFGELATEPEEAPPDVSAPERIDERVADRDALERALEALPAGLRTVVLLKDVYDLSCAEIAEEVGATEGAVKVRLHRARRRLRDLLFEGSAPDEV